MTLYARAAEFALTLPGPHLTAIHPDKTETISRFGKHFEQSVIRARTFGNRNIAEIEHWISLAQRSGHNVYFNVNDLAVELNKFCLKAHERDVSVLRYLHVDLDDPKDVTDPRQFKQVHAETVQRLLNYPIRPSLIIDTGNGFGGFWTVAPATAATDDNRLDLKSRNKALREFFDADHCENLDRVMRLPYTINFPNAAKRARGRKQILARVFQDWRGELLDGYPLEWFPQSADAPIPTSHSGDAYHAIGKPEIVDATDKIATLEPHLQKRIRTDEIDVGKRSEAVFAVCCELRRLGWSDGEIIGIITNPDLAIADHILDQPQRSNEEQAARVILSMNERGVTVANAWDDFKNDPVEPMPAAIGSARISLKARRERRQLEEQARAGDRLAKRKMRDLWKRKRRLERAAAFIE